MRASNADQPCIIPVAACDAFEWLAGRLHDRDLLLRSPLVPEAIFIVDLADRRGYRQMCALIKHLVDRGAVMLIARTGTPAVEHHFEANGGQKFFREDWGPSVKHRYCLPPAELKKWLAKWHRGSESRL